MPVPIPGSDVSRQAARIGRIFRFRHAIFVEENGWNELRGPDSLERDRFDDEHAIHHVGLRNDEIIGYQRLLPTTRSRFLTDVAGDLCRSRPPSGLEIQEWTRFCVAPALVESALDAAA